MNNSIHTYIKTCSSWLTDMLAESPVSRADAMGRFINTHGRIGKNISCDLHMEHLNRMCKDAVNHLGANKIPQAIVRVGKALGPLTDLLEQFDRSVGIHVSGSHTCRSNSKDMHIIVENVTCLMRYWVATIITQLPLSLVPRPTSQLRMDYITATTRVAMM